MYNKNLLKNLQDSVYVVEENGKKVNNDNFNRIIAPIYSQSNANTPIAPSPIITNNYSYDDMSIDELRNRYSDLTKQLANYKRTEKTGLWDKDKNVIDNIGNALYKLILEGDDKYVEDETYNKLNREYKAVSKALDNKSIEQYGNNMSVIDKVPYTIVGNLRTSTNGIESTVKKILGQTPETKELSYEEKMAQLASEQSSGLGKVGLDVLGSVSRMIPQMTVGDPKAALAMGFANYGGSAYNEAKQMGASEDAATKYGLTIGALETGLEKLLGGLESVYGKSVLGKTTDKIMNKVISNSTFRNMLTNMSGEFTEEYLQEFLEPIVRNVILEEENGADFWNAQNLESAVKQLASQFFNEQNLYAGTLGSITSGITNAPVNFKVNSEIKNIKNNINQNNVGEHLNQLFSKGYDIDTSLDIINEALEETGQATINDDIKKQLKKEIKDNFKQNTSNLPINSTVEQQNNNNNINNQNQNNIQNNTVKMQNNAILENNNKQTVVEDSKSFAEQVDDVLNNKYSEKNMLVVSKDTPKILQEIGLSNLPITMTQRHLKTIMNSSGKYQGANYHDLGVDLVKQLPEAINNPLNILQSDTKSDSIVIITELADKQNRPIIASIKIDGTGRVNDIEFDSNVMTSAYGRNNYDEFMKRNISKGNLLYDIDEGIIKRISGKLQLQPTDSERETRSRLQLPKGDNSSSKQIAPIKEQSVSNNDNTTNSTKSQIAPLPSRNNMQQVEKNIPVAKEKNTIAETKQNIAPVKKTTSDVEISNEQSKNANEQSEIARKTIKNKIEKAIQNQSNKAINTATKIGDSYIEFTRKEKASFKENLSKYIGMTREQLMNADTYNNIKDIVKKYADRTIDYTDNEIVNLKKEIRKTKIKIDENLRNQIDDYGDFRKQNFGKLALSKEGQSVDSLWQELSDRYPYYFSKDIQTEVDMLYQLSEFMNQDTTTTEKYRLDDDTIEETAAKVYNGLLSNTFNTETIEEMQNNLDEKSQKRTRKIVQDELITEMGITQDDLNVAKDINQIAIQRTDPIRLNEKVFGYKIGQKINDATINRTKHNEAERIRFLKSERSDIESLGIKARSKESAAVQKYAEKKYINQYGQEVQYGDNELMSEFSDVKTQEKIKRAAEMLRNKYDSYIDKINEVITNMGYDAIPKRNDYMRHFNELNDKLSKWGIPLNHESINSNNLPTDINGITEQFKPGKNWFASAMQRTGEKTTYDAITGIDGYLEGASNLIYHTEDIQRYRALSKMIRETFGQSKGFENLGGLTDSEVEQRIKDIQNNKLSKYVAWLDEQANSLAGKKGGIDRAAERVFGRKIYSILDTAKKQVGSNMTGFNVRSALTNFGSAVQGASKTNKLAFIKGTISTLQNIVHNDGLIDKSDFLTSRFGSKQLSSKLWQKAGNAGQIFMTGSDYFTANQIWRSKYYENLSKGMSEKTAIRNADDFSARIMGDRSKGATAEIFNSKTLGLLTQFQLEVNNQWSSIVHDNKMDIKSGNKSGATVLFQLGQLATMSYMFNNFMKALTGSSVMLDPIDMLKEIIGANDDDEETTIEQRAQEVLGNIVDNLPLANLITPMTGFGSGGRIPVSEAFKGAKSLIPGVLLGVEKDKYGNTLTRKQSLNNVIESAYYWLLPTGYGQLKKTTKGLSMYDKDLPVAGSYTDSGNLRFTADESAGGKIKAALFGQYSSKEADDYISSNYKTINANKIDEMKQLNMTSSEYRKYRQGLTDAGTTNKDKIDYITNLENISDSQKNIMASNLLGKDFNMKEYRKYNSYDEYNYAQKNPDKYAIIKQITSYDKYNQYSKKIKDIKDNSINDKNEVIKYVNSLNLSIPQKAMFIKTYYKSFKTYDKQIIEYIDNQKLSMTEKIKILTGLGFKMQNGIVVY